MEKEDPGVYWEVLDLDTKAKYAKNGDEVKTYWKIPENDDAKDLDYSSWNTLVNEGNVMYIQMICSLVNNPIISRTLVQYVSCKNNKNGRMFCVFIGKQN